MESEHMQDLLAYVQQYSNKTYAYTIQKYIGKKLCKRRLTKHMVWRHNRLQEPDVLRAEYGMPVDESKMRSDISNTWICLYYSEIRDKWTETKFRYEDEL